MNKKISKPVKLLFLKVARQDFGLLILSVFIWYMREKIKGIAINK